MKALWCFTSVILLSSICHAGIDVEKTVQQVQNILKANSGLPRLNRDEIIQLLNDIRAEDAKSSSASIETSTEALSTTAATNEKDNEINHKEEALENNRIKNDEDYILFSTTPGTMTNKGNIMLVLPYTPRDGASLQELYTKPPRVSLVPASEATTFKKNKFADSYKNPLEFTEDMQAFLDAHGLDGSPGQDHFLLPLDGFKPLPPAKIVDGNVQLPENILLTYDLISPEPEHIQVSKPSKEPNRDSYIYQPWKNKPFELETSASESKEQQVYPFDLPKSRQTKSTPSTPKPNYEPIDYDSVKVIPLGKGPSPNDDESASLENDPSKRQTNTTTETSTDAKQEESKSSENKSDATDSGASITDLEDSFGGAVPAEPGDSMLPPPKKNGFYWMLDWNSFLEVGDGDTKVNIRLEPKLGDPQMFIPVNVP